MNKEYVLFNINEFVKVKLTDKGYEFFTKYFNSDLQDAPQFMKTIQQFKKETDDDGYLKMPCHTFINCFGEEQPFITVHIKETAKGQSVYYVEVQ